MNKEQISAEFDVFFEFPTSDKSQVSSVSCKLFSMIMVEMALSQSEPALEHKPDTGILGSLGKNWTEDASHENGNYTCKCGTCGCMFLGHKRRVTCKECAVVSEPEHVSQFAIVPIEPTEDMLHAGDMHMEGISNLGDAWDAMIAAAPPYPESNFVESLDSWIPVSERLPENDLLVLIFTDNDDIITGSYSSVDYEGCWRIGNSSIIWDHNFNLNLIVNKWMPLPSAPKGEE